MKMKKMLSLFLAGALTVSSFSLWDYTALPDVHAEEVAEIESADAEVESAGAEVESADAEVKPADAEIESIDTEVESADAEVETAEEATSVTEETEITQELPAEKSIEFSVPVPEYGRKVTNKVQVPDNSAYQIFDVQWTKSTNSGTYHLKAGEYMDNGLYTISLKIAPNNETYFSDVTSANVNSLLSPTFYNDNGLVSDVIDAFSTSKVFIAPSKAYIQWTYTFKSQNINQNKWKVKMPECLEKDPENNTISFCLPHVFNNKDQYQDSSQFEYEWFEMKMATSDKNTYKTTSIQSIGTNGAIMVPLNGNDDLIYRCVVTQKDGSFIGQINIDSEDPVFETTDEFYIIPDGSSHALKLLFQDENGNPLSDTNYTYDWYKCDSSSCEINSKSIFLGNSDPLYIANNLPGYGNKDMNGHNMYLKCVYYEGNNYRGEATFSLYPELPSLETNPVATLREKEAYLTLAVPVGQEGHFFSLYLENVSSISVFQTTDEGDEFLDEYEPEGADDEIAMELERGAEYYFYIISRINSENGSDSASVILKRDGEIYNKSQSFSYTNKTQKATLTTDGYKYKECSDCLGRTITKVIPMVETVALSATSYVYDEKAKKPTVTVTDTAGKVLTLNTDYTVSYAAGRTNIGSYKVTVKGKGNYSFSKAVTFKVTPVKTSITKLTAGSKSFTATWNKKTSQVTGYQIQCSTSSDFKKDAKLMTITSYKTASATMKSLLAKKKYYVRIRTYKTVNGTKITSDWSGKKTITTK